MKDLQAIVERELEGADEPFRSALRQETQFHGCYDKLDNGTEGRLLLITNAEVRKAIENSLGQGVPGLGLDLFARFTLRAHEQGQTVTDALAALAPEVAEFKDQAIMSREDSYHHVFGQVFLAYVAIVHGDESDGSSANRNALRRAIHQLKL